MLRIAFVGLIFVGAMFGIAASPKMATTTTHNPTKDVRIYSPNSGANISTLYLDPAVGSVAFMQFDFSAIGSDKIITDASLQLSFDEEIIVLPSAQHGFIARSTRPAWTEAATFLTYDGSHSWTSAGGDYTMDGAASFALTESPALIDDKNFLTLMADAQENRSGILDIAILWYSSAPLSYPFSIYSSEHATASLRPLLTLTYTDGTAVIIDGSSQAPVDPSTLIEASVFNTIDQQTLMTASTLSP